jgi:hypothetical protein
VKNLVIGLLLGTAVSCFAAAELSRHYEANTDEAVVKCLQEATDKSEVSFKLTPNGVDESQATCWPDGIAAK